MLKLFVALSVLSMASFNSAQAASKAPAHAAPAAAPVAAAPAHTSSHTGSLNGAVGGDGCGLGWQVTDKRTLVGTCTRGTTNGFVPPSFGMTTGTIGCEKHQISKNEVPSATYVVANYQTLSTELAQGGGETVSGLAYVMGCSQASQELGRALQSHYDVVGNAQDGFELYHSVRGVVQSDASLAVQCGTTI